jgi:hypothetical protein
MSIDYVTHPFVLQRSSEHNFVDAVLNTGGFNNDGYDTTE